MRKHRADFLIEELGRRVTARSRVGVCSGILLQSSGDDVDPLTSAIVSAVGQGAGERPDPAPRGVVGRAPGFEVGRKEALDVFAD